MKFSVCFGTFGQINTPDKLTSFSCIIAFILISFHKKNCVGTECLSGYVIDNMYFTNAEIITLEVKVIFINFILKNIHSHLKYRVHYEHLQNVLQFDSHVHQIGPCSESLASYL
jgi:hypothetical protein